MVHTKTTSQLMDEYLATTGLNKAPKTQIYKRRLYDCILKFLNGKELTFEMAVAYQESIIASGKKTSSVLSYMKYLKAFVHWEFQNDYIEKNWTARLLLPKKDPKAVFPRIPSELADKIIDAGTTPEPFVFGKGGDNPGSTFIKGEMRLGLRFILRTGVRIEEARSIEGKDLDFNADPPEFWSTKKGSSGQKSPLPMPVDMIEVLRQRQDRKRVFEITDHGCNIALKRGVEKLDLKLPKKLTVHSLRHLLATNALRNGTPLTTVQHMLRHASFRTTAEMYVETDMIDVAEAVNSMPNVQNGLTREERKEGAEKLMQKYVGHDKRFRMEVVKNEKGLFVSMIDIEDLPEEK